MRHIEDFSDLRHKVWCIHCGATLANLPANRDHVPTKSLLSKALRERGKKYDTEKINAANKSDQNGYLPQVVICKNCNSGFSRDETYLLCVLHAVIAGSLYPNPNQNPEAANVLRSNRDIVRVLKFCVDGQLHLFDGLHPFIIYPDIARIKNVVLKNARGHAYHELGEPLLDTPEDVSFISLANMTEVERTAFEEIGGGLDVWPEVGSRMMLRGVGSEGMTDGWIVVEDGRYRYALDWSAGVTVRTVIWEYLATETRWAA